MDTANSKQTGFGSDIFARALRARPSGNLRHLPASPTAVEHRSQAARGETSPRR